MLYILACRICSITATQSKREESIWPADGETRTCIPQLEIKCFELNSSKADAEEELILSRWCIALLCSFTIFYLWLSCHPRSKLVILDYRFSWYQWRRCREDADKETRNRAPR